MFIIKWVQMDDNFNYYPCSVIFDDYDKAKEFLSCKEEILESQSERVEELFEGKIISEIYLEEIKLDCQNV